MMISYCCTLKNDHHNKSSYHSLPYRVTIFFMIIFKIYSLSNFQICNTILLIRHHATPCIFMAYLFCTWKFISFDLLHPSYQAPPASPLATTSLFSVSVRLCFAPVILFVFLFYYFRVYT